MFAFDAFETEGVYSEKFSNYLDNFTKVRDSFNDYNKKVSGMIKEHKSYSEILSVMNALNLERPSIPVPVEDETIETIEDIVKATSEYEVMKQSCDTLKNEIDEKRDLAMKMRAILKIKRNFCVKDENMNEAEKIVFNLEKEVNEKSAELANLGKKCSQMRAKIVNNEMKIYQYTKDNIKALTTFLKIKNGVSYNDNHLVAAINKMITTPIEVIFKKELDKADPTENGYSAIDYNNYSSFDDDPTSLPKTASVKPEFIGPFNNNSRITNVAPLRKTDNNLREMAAITTEAGFKSPLEFDTSKPHLVSITDKNMSPFDKLIFPLDKKTVDKILLSP